MKLLLDILFLAFTIHELSLEATFYKAKKFFFFPYVMDHDKKVTYRYIYSISG